jgi:hypothetical protein
MAGLSHEFEFKGAVDVPQAGMAGAATGAAMGASLDLLAGGLTLGAAAAVGALLGGGAASVAAAWKNRQAPSGGTVVQLSEDMLDALAKAALLRYLAVVHAARSGEPPDVQRIAAWAGALDESLRAHRDSLMPLWMLSRTQPGTLSAEPLADELGRIARDTLQRVGGDAASWAVSPTAEHGAVLQGNG